MFFECNVTTLYRCINYRRKVVVLPPSLVLKKVFSRKQKKPLKYYVFPIKRWICYMPYRLFLLSIIFLRQNDEEIPVSRIRFYEKYIESYHSTVRKITLAILASNPIVKRHFKFYFLGTVCSNFFPACFSVKLFGPSVKGCS